MIQPNSACAQFCYWMLNISEQKLSGPQRLLVEEIYTAAISTTPVTDQDWYNFNLFTAWRNPYYLVYRDYAASVAPNLNSMLVSAYNLDGNSNDPVSGNNGTDTAITYGLPYGKINQGALFNGSSSEIVFSAFTPGSTYSVGCWVNPAALGSGDQGIIGDIVNFTGLYINKTTFLLEWQTNFHNYFTTPVPSAAWSCVVVTCDGSYIRMYLNGTLDAITNTPAGFPAITRIGRGRTGGYYNGSVDIVNFWDRVLSPTEVQQFWNSSAGIQYPF